MKSDESEVKKGAKKIGEAIKQSEKDEKNPILSAEQIADMYLKSGHAAKDIFGLTEAQVEGFYAQAYNFYQTGQYKDAVQLFRMLILLSPSESKYVMGLAACLHMLKDYDGAIKAYTMCSLLDSDNPVPFFHMSDCFIEMNDLLSAIITLETAIDYAGEKKEYTVLKDRAHITLKALKQNVEKEIKEKSESIVKES